MQLISNYLYVIDRDSEAVENAPFNESLALGNYVMNVLNTVIESTGDREYRFQPESLSMQTWLNKIIKQEDVEETCRLIAARLLSKEIDAQDQIEHLGKDIPKGMLIISFVDMQLSENNEQKVIISKADYNEFIEQTTGELRTGLPTKKKIYKAFIANVRSGNIVKRMTYDSNSKIATYWWREFLELDVVRHDEVNTQRAFDTIVSEVINPVKRQSKQDYLNLWNITLGHFRLDGEFDLDYYRDEILGNYHSCDNNVSISDLQTRCNNLPNRGDFDRRFTKNSLLLKGKKYKQIISLTNEINLTISDYIANMAEVLQAEENDAGEKFLKIKSNAGYEYAKRLRTANNE